MEECVLELWWNDADRRKPVQVPSPPQTYMGCPGIEPSFLRWDDWFPFISFNTFAYLSLSFTSLLPVTAYSIIFCIPIWTKKYRYSQHRNYTSHRQGVLNQIMYLKTVFVVYWTTLSDYDSVEWQWIPNWNGHRRQRSWPNLRYYTGDCVRGKPGTCTVKIVIVSAGIRTGHFPHNLHYNVKARGALHSLRRT